MEQMGGWIWALVVVGGPILLGLALFVGSRRRLSRTEKAQSDEVARQNWNKERIR